MLIMNVFKYMRFPLQTTWREMYLHDKVEKFCKVFWKVQNEWRSKILIPIIKPIKNFFFVILVNLVQWSEGFLLSSSWYQFLFCSCIWVSVFIKKKNHQKERNEACERVFGIDSTAVLCISLSKRVQQLKQFIYNICLDMHEGYKFCFQPTIKARLFATVEIGKWDSQQRC